MSSRRRQSVASVTPSLSAAGAGTPTESVRSGRSTRNRVTVHGKDVDMASDGDAETSSLEEQPTRTLRKRNSTAALIQSTSRSTPSKQSDTSSRRHSTRIDTVAAAAAKKDQAPITPQPTRGSQTRRYMEAAEKARSAAAKLPTQKMNNGKQQTPASTRKGRDDFELSDSEESNGDPMDISDNEKASSRGSDRQIIVPAIKRKKWATHGMYTGQETQIVGKSTLKSKRGQSAARKESLPLPMYKGLTTMEAERDFVLPYTIFNLDPWVYPKPPGWKSLKRNIFVGEAAELYKQQKNSRKNAYQSTMCNCTPESGGCGPGCLNRVMYYECDKNNCSLKDCQNRPFRDLAIRVENDTWFDDGIEIILTQDKGYGLRACRSFGPNQIIVEYIGEIITQDECEERLHGPYKDNESYYLMEFDNSLIIDATRGSLARFVNHSCSPNCKMEKWMVAGQPRMALFAGDEGIEVGEELTYDYNFSWFSGGSTQLCRCGTEQCRGLVGKRNERRISTPIPEPAPKPVKRTRTVKAPPKPAKREIRKKVVKASNARVVKTKKGPAGKASAAGPKGRKTAPKKVAVKPKPAARILAKKAVAKKAATKKVAAKRVARKAAGVKAKVVRATKTTKTTTTKAAKGKAKATTVKKTTKTTTKTVRAAKSGKGAGKGSKPRKVRASLATDGEQPQDVLPEGVEGVPVDGEHKEGDEETPDVLKKPKEKTHRVTKPKPPPKPKPAPEQQVVKRLKWVDGQLRAVEMRLTQAPPVQKSPATTLGRRRLDKKPGDGQLDDSILGVQLGQKMQLKKIQGRGLSPGSAAIDPALVGGTVGDGDEYVIPDSQSPEPEVPEMDEYDSEEDDYANDLNFVKWPSAVARAYGISDNALGLTTYRKITGYYTKITEFDQGPVPDEPSSKYTYVKVPRTIRVQQQSQWESDPEQEIEKATTGPPQYVRIGQSYVLYTKEVALGKLGKARTLYMRQHGRYKPWKADGPLPRKTLKEKLKLKQKRLPKPPPRDGSMGRGHHLGPAPPGILHHPDYSFTTHGTPGIYERPDYRPGFRSPNAFLSAANFEYNTLQTPFVESSDDMNTDPSLKRKFGIGNILNEGDLESHHQKRQRYINPDEDRATYAPNPFNTFTTHGDVTFTEASAPHLVAPVTDPQLLDSNANIEPSFTTGFDGTGGFVTSGVNPEDPGSPSRTGPDFSQFVGTWPPPQTAPIRDETSPLPEVDPAVKASELPRVEPLL
ncbi:hypothetical protein TWF569_004193 [Orbilia oligospora]|uniref:Histone-lysine N-methyltransferase n=1 Tax=Orbilia oligospora TaxID=2813651 RepID=A0A7C8JRT1_ORBOL|nr:hypothetical protein TWF102_010935 [Orbilia oligospora]KAF3095783.1 hypothetical protein TWF103_010014 [Orbilia oligospora]KAF3138387.1 hypothetical protein TWF594_007208 [Orbilia oligospora]KAF3139145.1 hypothetical protein TWF703_004085 [Orbilia oligospora]KAF3151215.1 hypothetical protein TWF569_004193 [Orbilia oligospora]